MTSDEKAALAKRLRGREPSSLVDAFRVLWVWNEKDTYPYMKRSSIGFLAPRFTWILCIAGIVIHFIWALNTNCSVNFQRGGAVVVFAAALCYALVDWHKSDAAVFSGSPVKKLSLMEPLFVCPLFGTIGTIIWGYGDLITWFGNCCSAVSGCT